ncbi:RNA-splicing factor [Mucor velutinosus]|uniref:RNA-splicing factor n=1 Tax=Mucor velutinosus TaxID=708070 RepID=A0AAN7DKK5_9FUNG|nr:RNA-splicing factor [Mucor velutinosus]
MKFITITVAGLILLESALVYCQDSAGLMRLAANAGIFADTGNAISTNSSVDQNCLSDLPEVVMAWLQHFNAIVLETFVVSSGHSISGPLYVQGQFIGQFYSVNGQSTVDCSPENEDIISNTGLVIDFTTGT